MIDWVNKRDFPVIQTGSIVSDSVFITFHTLGLTAAVAGKWVDVVISRLVDVVLSIPLLIWALMILNVLGQSLFSLVITIAFLDSTRVFRLARALGMNLASLDFVEVARLRG